jgi:drug/metabolite transporter (DMT)-like permease
VLRRGDAVLAPLVLVMVIWALNVTIVKWAVDAWEPLAFSFLRFAVGGGLFAGWVLWREGSLRVARRDVPLLLLAAAFGIFLNQLCFMYATVYAPAGVISLLMATAPAFAAVAAAVLGLEVIRRGHWLGLAVAGVGVLLVLWGSGASLELSSIRGDLLALGMAASWAWYSVAIRPLMRRYSATRISALVLLLGAPMLLPFSWGQLGRQDYGALDAGLWGALAYSCLVALVFTNLIWFDAVHRAGTARTTAVLPVQPFVGAVLAFLLLGERLAALEWIGGALVIAGIVVTQRVASGRGYRPSSPISRATSRWKRTA